MLHLLVSQYGPRRVWRVGLRELKYPPTWMTTGLELIAIQHHLRNGEH